MYCIKSWMYDELKLSYNNIRSNLYNDYFRKIHINVIALKVFIINVSINKIPFMDRMILYFISLIKITFLMVVRIGLIKNVMRFSKMRLL